MLIAVLLARYIVHRHHGSTSSFLFIFKADQNPSLLKKVFEGHAVEMPIEMLVKASAEGDLEKIEVLCRQQKVDVSELVLGFVDFIASGKCVIWFVLLHVYSSWLYNVYNYTL